MVPVVSFRMMQYLAYISIVTALPSAWLFWASPTAVQPVGSAQFHAFNEDPHLAAVLKERAIAALSSAQTGARQSTSSAAYVSPRLFLLGYANKA